jgi:hypothetical protein
MQSLVEPAVEMKTSVVNDTLPEVVDALSKLAPHLPSQQAARPEENGPAASVSNNVNGKTTTSSSVAGPAKKAQPQKRPLEESDVVGTANNNNDVDAKPAQ